MYLPVNHIGTTVSPSFSQQISLQSMSLGSLPLKRNQKKVGKCILLIAWLIESGSGAKA